MPLKGFTLIELLVVMTILGILATIGIGNFQTARIKARDITRKSDLSTIAKSLEAYVNDHRAYPLSDVANKIKCKDDGSICDWDGPFTDSASTVYVSKLPSDPGGFTYSYLSSDGKSYALYTHLENDNDPSVTTFNPEVMCGPAKCNYKITSSNL